MFTKDLLPKTELKKPLNFNLKTFKFGFTYLSLSLSLSLELLGPPVYAAGKTRVLGSTMKADRRTNTRTDGQTDRRQVVERRTKYWPLRNIKTDSFSFCKE